MIVNRRVGEPSDCSSDERDIARNAPILQSARLTENNSRSGRCAVRSRRAARDFESQLERTSIELLERASLKRTRPRIAVLKLLLKNHGPFGVQGIVESIPDGLCDPVTVYRCLEAFEMAGLVRRCDFGDGVVRYESVRSDEHHHHLVCTGCQTVERLELKTCPTDPLERLARGKGYRKVQHSLEIFGLCPRCQAVA